ncbi:MAG: ABC transporter ATP-binding protein [Candidatus Dormiibacterota bacterium]
MQAHETSTTRGLVVLALLLGTTVVILGAFSHVVTYAQARLRRATSLVTQRELFAAVNSFPGLEEFENPAFYDRLRIAQYLGQLAPAQVLQITFLALQSCVLFFGFLGSLIPFGWPIFTALTLAALPAALIELGLNRLRQDTTWRSAALARRQFFYSGMQSDLQAAKEIRVFGFGAFLLDRMQDALRGQTALENQLDRRQLHLQVLGMAVEGLVSAACLGYVVLMAFAHSLAAGDVALFASASIGLQSGLGGVSQAIVQGQQAFTNFAHYRAITRDAAKARDAIPQRKASPLRSVIHIDDVWFRYDPAHQWTLKGVNLSIRRGSIVALVGANGAGKSTIVKLLCSFYRPTQGCLRWDGADFADFTPESIRTRMAAVFQDFMAYELTIGENIGIGDIEMVHRREEVLRAAELVGMKDTIESFPHGLETLLSRIFASGAQGKSERGTTLSGGQWQRIAIARALVRKDADLVILDEPSSGLDAEGEDRLTRHILAHRGDRAVLLVSQRLGTVRLADEIIVLEGGTVVERGDHGSLMRQNGEYARLFRLQAAGYGADDGGPSW